MIMPRQARDKHREVEKEVRFPQAHQFEGTALVFYAVRPIAAREPLCFAYTMPSQPTAQRHKLLAASFLVLRLSLPTVYK